MAIRIFGRERKQIDLRYPDFDLLPEAEQRRIVMKIRQELAEESAALQRMLGGSTRSNSVSASESPSGSTQSPDAPPSSQVSTSVAPDSSGPLPQKPNTQCRPKRDHKTSSRYRQSWYRRRW